MTIKVTTAAAAATTTTTTKQQQPKQRAGLFGSGKIMKSAQIHKYTNTHTAKHTYTNNKNNNHLSSLKYLHPKDVTPHTRFSVIHYYLYEKLFIICYCMETGCENMNWLELAVDSIHTCVSTWIMHFNIFCNPIPSVLELILFRHDLNIANSVILINRWYCPDLVNLSLQLRKKAVKEEKAEKRRTKIKKHVKKRKEKVQQKKKWINILLLILYLKWYIFKSFSFMTHVRNPIITGILECSDDLSWPVEQ